MPYTRNNTHAITRRRYGCMSQNRAPSSRLVGIDFLRAIAVLAVVVSHSPYSLGVRDPRIEAVPATPDWYNTVASFGVWGVQLFLVISGFCIHMPWARKGNTQATVAFVPFWFRRQRRLYPPYVVAVVASFALLAMYYGFVGARPSPEWFGVFGYTSLGSFIFDIVVLATLCQNFTNASSRAANGPFWSLALEEQLYALYFALLHTRRRWGWRVALPLALGTSLLWNFLGFIAFDVYPNWWLRIGPSRWFEWTLGAIAVEAHLGMVTVPAVFRSKFMLFALAGISVVLAPMSGLDLDRWGAAIVRDPLLGVTFFTVVFQTALWERNGFGPWTRFVNTASHIGVWSYGIYLIHAPLLPAIKHLVLKAGIENSVAIVICRIVISLLAGWVFHRLVETRFMNAPGTTAAIPSVTH
jgi:peptidoglycan/LPS O-acetylase OafA/YrhL